MKNLEVLLLTFLIALDAQSQTLYVKRNNAYVREGPASFYPLIVVLQYGSRLHELASSGNWYKIKAPEEQMGWVAANCLSDKQTQAEMMNQISKSWSSARASRAGLAAAIKGFAQKCGKVDSGDVAAVFDYSHKDLTGDDLAAFNKPLVDNPSRNRGKLDLDDLDFKTPEYDPLFDEQGVGVGIAARLISKGIVTDPEMVRYVNMIAAVVAQNSGIYDWDFTVFILNDNHINGYACPGGYIFVTLGAVKACEDESMLAAIIAHEMGHVIRRHGLQEMTNRLADIKADEAFDELEEETQEKSELDEQLESLAQDSYDIVVHKRLLEYETEADKISAVLCANAGYDPFGIVRMAGKVLSLENSNPDIFETDADFILQADSPKRFEEISEFVNKHYSEAGGGSTMRERFESEISHPGK